MSEASPPGPAKLPLVGNAHQLADPLAFSTRCREFDSPVVGATAGSTPVYVVQRPESIEAVLVGESGSFRKPDFLRDRFARALGYPDVEYDDSLGMALRAPWQGPAIRKAFESRTETVSSATRNAFRRASGSSSDLQGLFQQLLFEVFSTVAFGTDAVDAPDLGATIDAVSKKLAPRQVGLSEAVPLWDRVPTPTNRRFDRAVSRMDALVGDLLEHSDPDAPFGRLYDVIEETGAPADAVVPTEVATIIVGALEPVAVVAAMSCDELARNPDVQDRLRTAVEGLDGPPTPDRLASVDYLDAVVSEALRLYSPLYTIFRTVTDPVTICGYDFEPDATVWLPIRTVQRDPRYFDRPETFDPDRWLDPDFQPGFAYVPFGGGARQCAGREFAVRTLRLLLATVVQTARLRPVGDPPTLRAELGSEPADGVELAVEARQ